MRGGDREGWDVEGRRVVEAVEEGGGGGGREREGEGGGGGGGGRLVNSEVERVAVGGAEKQ